MQQRGYGNRRLADGVQPHFEKRLLEALVIRRLTVPVGVRVVVGVLLPPASAVEEVLVSGRSDWVARGVGARARRVSRFGRKRRHRAASCRRKRCSFRYARVSVQQL
jgi:hypothetical protein